MGAVSGVKKILGMERQDGRAGTVADQMREITKAPGPAAATVEAREGAEERAARRRMRRGGRALLSEARLNPEQGVSTLGQTGL